MQRLQERDLENWAKTRLEVSTRNLLELASIDSATLKVSEVAKVQQRLADTFARLGMSVDFQEQVDRGPLLVARTHASTLSSGDIALIGHADTVRDLNEELSPITIEGDIMRGTGVYDMKGGLVGSSTRSRRCTRWASSTWCRCASSSTRPKRIRTLKSSPQWSSLDPSLNQSPHKWRL